jgi:hypothetical protein
MVQPTRRELARRPSSYADAMLCIIAATASHLQDAVGVRAFVGGISIYLDTQILSQAQELVHVIVGRTYFVC